MKLLPYEFDGRADQRGFHFRILKRSRNDVVLLEKQNEKGRKFYEVAIVQKWAGCTLPDGRVIEAGEGLPSANQWGVLGFSLDNLETAEKRFQEMLKA